MSTTENNLLPVNVLREVARLFPDHADALDDWQRAFCQDQIARLEKWGDDVRLSDKQTAVLRRCLQVLQAADAGGDA